MTDFIKSSFRLTITEFFLIGLAILRIKVVAIKIGPEGLGVYSLLNGFFAILMVISASWMCSLIVKYLSECRSKNDFISMSNIINIAIVISVLLGACLLFFSIVYHEYILRTFFDNQISVSYYVIFSFSCIGFSLKSIFTSILQAMLDINTTVKYRIFSSIMEILVTIILVSLWGVYGFILSFVVSSLFHIFYLVRYLLRQTWYEWGIDLMDKALKNNLVHFGGLNIILSVISAISQHYQKIITTVNLNILYVGYFQASQSIMNYMGVLNRSSSFVVLPAMSEDVNLEMRNLKINEYMRFTILSNAFISCITIVFANNLIQILYSDRFLKLCDFIVLFVLAQFLISVELILQSVIIGITMFRLHFVVSVINVLVWLIIPFTLMNVIGFYAIPFSLIVASIIVISVDYLALKNRKGLLFSMSNLVLFFSSILLIILLGTFSVENIYLKFIEFAIIMMIFLLVISKEEKSNFKSYCHQKLSKIRCF